MLFLNNEIVRIRFSFAIWLSTKEYPNGIVIPAVKVISRLPRFTCYAQNEHAHMGWLREGIDFPGDLNKMEPRKDLYHHIQRCKNNHARMGTL